MTILDKVKEEYNKIDYMYLFDYVGLILLIPEQMRADMEKEYDESANFAGPLNVDYNSFLGYKIYSYSGNEIKFAKII
jgi:hypothetical protein